MYIFEAIFLGIIQGLTEFLPISSSAHLTLVPQLFGWKGELLHSLSFDVALHLGTMLAVFIYFGRDIWVISMRFVQGIIKRQPFENENSRLGWFIIIGTIPVIIGALSFKDAIESIFRHPVMVSIMLIGFALVMIWAEKIINKGRVMRSLTWKDALIIGLAQTLALMPGVSRSGVTISAGLFLGFRREQSARFAFLLSIPAIVGATVFAIKGIIDMAMDQSWITMLIGCASATIAGYLCISFLLAFLKKRSLLVFVIYRLILGISVIIWFLNK